MRTAPHNTIVPDAISSPRAEAVSLSKKFTLQCPCCMGDDFRQTGDYINIYRREIYAPTTERININPIGVTAKHIASEYDKYGNGNPSPHQGAITIDVKCTNPECGQDNILGIIEHKGKLYFEWI